MRLFFALLTASALIATPAIAKDSPEESAIKARQGQMELKAFNAGPLIAMVKRDIPYDAEQAGILANNLKKLDSMLLDGLWLENSSTDDYPDKTAALPEIWKSQDKFEQRNQEYSDAVAALAKVADQGLGELAPKVKDLGNACKSCHDDFREKN